MSYYYFIGLAAALGACIYFAATYPNLRNRNYHHNRHTSKCNTSKDFVDTSDICTICRDQIDASSRDVRYLLCGHSFHELCVAEWLKRKNACPNCNFDQRI